MNICICVYCIFFMCILYIVYLFVYCLFVFVFIVYLFVLFIICVYLYCLFVYCIFVYVYPDTHMQEFLLGMYTQLRRGLLKRRIWASSNVLDNAKPFSKVDTNLYLHQLCMKVTGAHDVTIFAIAGFF